MSSFTTPLLYEPIKGLFRRHRQVYRILKPFAYQIGAKGSAAHIDVANSYQTDFASFPHWLSKFGFKSNAVIYRKASLIHDQLLGDKAQVRFLQKQIFKFKNAPLYFFRIDLGTMIKKPLPHRLFCDLVFFEAMGVQGVSRPLKYLMFCGVRVGAARAWVRGLFNA